jgi:Ca2+-binding RTX toxin-like protein
MTRRTFRPWFECLEERANPGVVTVSFAAGTLTLTGSTGADSIAISQPSFGVIQVVGDGTTPIRIGATGPIVAAGTPVTFGSAAAPVKSLNANLALGNDTFTIDETNAINLSGSATIDLGGGTAQLLNVTNTGASATPKFFAVGGSLTAKGGSGVDTITLDDVTAGGNVTITGGGGADSLTLERAVIVTPGDPLAFVGGNVVISGGVGAETITIGELDVRGLTTLNTGTGNVVTGVNAEVDVGFAGDQMFLRGGLQILDGAGNTGTDSITFTAGALTEISGPPTGGLLIQTGTGADTITINDLINTAGTRITTGAGADTILIDSTVQTATFGGPFQMNTGDGDDTLEIGNAGPVDFLNSVSVQMGAGNDSLTLATTGPVGFSAGFLAVFDGGGGLTGGFNQKTVNAANITGPLPQLLNFF